MRKLILRMATTLDGVVAGENNEMDMFDFRGTEDVWDDLFATLEGVDTMLLGRGMHEGYIAHWQAALDSSTASEDERKYARIAARTRHLILSRSPVETLAWPNAQVLRGGVAEIASLKGARGADILLYGGPTAAAAAINAGFVDEYHLAVHPVVAGGGKKLFGSVDKRHRLRHRDTKTYASGVNLLRYVRA
jgi:dihydrofolate reductase